MQGRVKAMHFFFFNVHPPPPFKKTLRPKDTFEIFSLLETREKKTFLKKGDADSRREH